MFGNTVSITPTAASVYSAEVITGRELDRRLRHSNSAQRALLAYDLTAGGIRVDHLTDLQSRCLTGVGYYLATMRRLSEQQRDRIRSGQLSLTELHPRRHPLPPTDADIDCIVAKLGAERVMAALDRYTAAKIAAE